MERDGAVDRAAAHGGAERARTCGSRASSPGSAGWGGSPPFVRATARIGPAGPSEAARRRNRFTVVAEATGPGGAAAPCSPGATSGLTALLLVRGAQALVAGEARGSGVLAPAEAFDARTLAPVEPLLSVAEPT